MIAHQRWTQTDITELRSRLEASGSVLEIADAMQRPAANIAEMMSRLRLRLPR